MCTELCWGDAFGWKFASGKAVDAIGWWPCKYTDCATNESKFYGFCAGYKDGKPPINSGDSWCLSWR